MLSGEFAALPVEKNLANTNVNAVSNVVLLQYFMKRMQSAALRGCVVFTCSSGAYMPAPFSSLYPATKSFIAALTYSVASESSLYGIDVHAVFPSPTNTNFTANLDSRLKSLEMVWKYFGSSVCLPSDPSPSISRIKCLPASDARPFCTTWAPSVCSTASS